MGEFIMPYLMQISEFKKNNWDGGLTGLKYARKYEKNTITENQLEEINNLINLLTKTDFESRYIKLSSSYSLEDDETYSSEKLIVAIIELADEFINNKLPWVETLPLFYKKKQVFAYHFGKRLIDLLKDDENEINRFINFSLNIIAKIPSQERNFTVLGGFVSNSSELIKKDFYSKLFLSVDFRCQLFYFLSIDNSGLENIDLLFQLIDMNSCDVTNFYTFTYSNVLPQLNLDELITFSEKLFKYGHDGYAIVFDLLFDLSYGEELKKIELIPIIRKCILYLGFNREYKRQLDGYKWTKAISLIISIKEEVEFAKFINISIINSITWENSYHLDPYIQNVYDMLIKIHFVTIWGELSDALLSTEENYIKFYGLKNILGSQIGGIGRSVGLLFDGDLNLIFNWCENNKPLAPARLAELTPIFDNNNPDSAKWHPVANRLIDDFGEIKEVLSNLSSNMWSFSWTGSLVPFLESKKELFMQLTDHKTAEVRDWATTFIDYLDKEIELEINRDAERYI
jgi:hypothetical protein